MSAVPGAQCLGRTGYPQSQIGHGGYRIGSHDIKVMFRPHLRVYPAKQMLKCYTLFKLEILKTVRKNTILHLSKDWRQFKSK